MELSSKAAKVWDAISVVANSEVGRKRIRATSRATLPLTEVQKSLSKEHYFPVPVHIQSSKQNNKF